MYLSKKERDELSDLSKFVFGRRSAWQKAVKSGLKQKATRTITEEVPGENGAPATTKESQVPMLTSDGHEYSVVKYYTVESIRAIMIDLKAQIEKIQAQFQADQAAAREKEKADKAAKAVQDAAQGSAI